MRCGRRCTIPSQHEAGEATKDDADTPSDQQPPELVGQDEHDPGEGHEQRAGDQYPPPTEPISLGPGKSTGSDSVSWGQSIDLHDERNHADLFLPKELPPP